MKCPLFDNQWCSYYFRGGCWFNCGEGKLVPSPTDKVDNKEEWCNGPIIGMSWNGYTEWVWREMTNEELMEEIRFCEFVIKNVVPNNPLDRMSVAETAQIKGFATQSKEQAERCMRWRRDDTQTN